MGRPHNCEGSTCQNSSRKDLRNDRSNVMDKKGVKPCNRYQHATTQFKRIAWWRKKVAHDIHYAQRVAWTLRTYFGRSKSMKVYLFVADLLVIGCHHWHKVHPKFANLCNSNRHHFLLTWRYPSRNCIQWCWYLAKMGGFLWKNVLTLKNKENVNNLLLCETVKTFEIKKFPNRKSDANSFILSSRQRREAACFPILVTMVINVTINMHKTNYIDFYSREMMFLHGFTNYFFIVVVQHPPWLPQQPISNQIIYASRRKSIYKLNRPNSQLFF